MCEIMEKYLSEAKNEGKTEERIKAIQKMLYKGFDKQTILSLDYTEEEYQEAEAAMLAPDTMQRYEKPGQKSPSFFAGLSIHGVYIYHFSNMYLLEDVKTDTYQL